MPRAPLEAVVWGNGILLGVGALATVALIRWLWVRQQLTNPLIETPAPTDLAPGNRLVFAALGLFMLSSILPSILVKPERFADPGTGDWFTAVTITMVVRVLLGVLGWILLVRMLPAPADPPKLRPALTLGQQWAIVGVVTLVSLAVCTGLAEGFRQLWLLTQPGDPPQHAVLTALENNQWGLRGEITLAAGAVLIAPLFEEVIFRGLLLAGIWRISGGESPWPAALASSLMFGLIHFPQPHVVLPLAVFGLFLAIVQIRTGRLWIPIVIHGLFNLRTMASTLLNPEILKAGF